MGGTESALAVDTGMARWFRRIWQALLGLN